MKSLREASLALSKPGVVVRSLILRGGDDLVCKQMFCQFLGQGCACRLAVVLPRFSDLEELDVSASGLRDLPDSCFELPKLHTLDASQNLLQTLPPASIVRQAISLHHLNLANNPLESLPWDALRELPLKTLNIQNTPLTTAPEIDALRESGITVHTTTPS